MTIASARTTICLVRHGETEWNRIGRYQGQADIPLNETGLTQAAVVAEAISRELAWDAIVSSPLARAYQTAEAIANATGVRPIELDDDLKERGYGVAEGTTLAERLARWPGDDWPGLEPYDSMRRRGLDALNRVVRAHRGERVLVVCHGGVMNAVLAHYSGGEYGTGITVIRNTARSFLVHTDGAWDIQTVIDASHLEVGVP